jgi:hypothetical protein
LAGHIGEITGVNPVRAELLGQRPVRSELVYMLVSLDKQYTADDPIEPWEHFYAQRLAQHFSAPDAAQP